MKGIKFSISISAFLILLLAGCAPKNNYYKDDVISDNKNNKVTLGTVQKEIKIGMNAVEVLEVLGSPNIVSTDSKRLEVWVYDKMSTQGAFQSSSSFLIVFATGDGSYAQTQKALTIIIKFDENKNVRDMSYHSSSF